MKEIDGTIKERLLNSYAAPQWKKITFNHHHGIALPLFSLYSLSSSGIGEYPDLIHLISWCKEIGFTIIQLLPLNDTGGQSSPYGALSAFALNPLHLGLSALPYLENNIELLSKIKELQLTTFQTRHVDYKNISILREEFLRNYYSIHASRILSSSEYLKFIQNESFWIHDFAIFKALKILQGWKSFNDWLPDYQHPTSEFLSHPPDYIAKEAEYHKCVQYLCFQQLKDVKKIAEKFGIYLKGDIPILIDRESADVWRHPNLFNLNLIAGAPPDLYAADGQKWGFPLYNWEILQESNNEWWIQRLRVAAQFYHLYRLDHIVGFFRIWGIPLELKAKEGSFIPTDERDWIPQGEKIMRILLENCPMLPIGEDLGTIPPSVRECLKFLGICGTKVMRWERDWNGDRSFINPSNYPIESMTTVSTHDSETLRSWWKNNLEDASDYARFRGWSPSNVLSNEHHFSILSSSHHSQSFFHINLLQEYTALIPEMASVNPEEERINIPGTISEKNWTYRLCFPIEKIIMNKELTEIMKKLIS